MVLGPIFQAVLNEVKEAEQRKKGSPYWDVCPACGRRVVKKELVSKGCYTCGWQATEQEFKRAKTKSAIQERQLSDSNIKGGSYRINCPHCGRQVIRQELEKMGCFICGYKPERF